MKFCLHLTILVLFSCTAANVLIDDFTSEAIVEHCLQIQSKESNNHLLTLNIINNSTLQLGFPSAFHFSGGTIMLPPSLKPLQSDIFITAGTSSTEGVLNLPVLGTQRALILYWNIPNKNISKKNSMAVVFGQDYLEYSPLNHTFIQNLRELSILSDDALTVESLEGIKVQITLSGIEQVWGNMEITFTEKLFPPEYLEIYISSLLGETIRNLGLKQGLTPFLQPSFEYIADRELTEWRIIHIKDHTYFIKNCKANCFLTRIDFNIYCLQDDYGFDQYWEIIRKKDELYSFKLAGTKLYLTSFSDGTGLFDESFGELSNSSFLSIYRVFRSPPKC